jgi:hypothetical protein
MRWIWLLLVLTAVPQRAWAHVERFAVVIGNDRGASDEPRLLYAESDATRVHDVLLQLGDVSPLNSVLLRGRDASYVRNALLAVNERVRDAANRPGVQVVLIIYFSGHADANALHLDDSRLPLTELQQIARGSAANFRLVVVDACRSGALTRVKGGTRVAPFAMPAYAEDPPPGDGIAFLTASSAHEDAQESDELRGAFFTHAFTTGLLGAADSDGDGAVVLDEVYRYAYAATLRMTSQTFAGTQHPTFEYDLRGHGQLVLSRPQLRAAARATVVFPSDLEFLIMRDSPTGSVVVELQASDKRRELSLEPGTYFIRARAAELMYEGTLRAALGASTSVDVRQLSRVDYAKLVRRGGAPAPKQAHGPLLGVSVRSALPNASAPCIGPFLGYSLELQHIGIGAQLAMCDSSLDNAVLSARVRGYSAELRAYHSWELWKLSWGLGLHAGVSLYTQDFDTRGRAPARTTASPYFAAGLSSQLDIADGYYAALQGSAETHFLPLIESREAGGALAASFAVRAGLSVGKYF